MIEDEKIKREAEEMASRLAAPVVENAPVAEAPAQAAPAPAQEAPAGYFNDALFIGDSRMVGIATYAPIEGATNFGTVGLSTYKIAEAVSEVPDTKGQTFQQVLGAKKYGKVYLACETNPDTYSDRRLTSDHMAVLGALGIYPDSRLINDTIMSNTLSWVMDNWNWNHTWGWDYPMTAMCAARLNRPDDAVSILLNKERTNTYLPNGHNFQDQRLRCYLPGNG